MEKQVSLDLHGITFYITVEYEDNSVCGVVDVRTDPTGKPLKCDITRFYDELVGELQEALEEELRNDFIAHCEMMMDAKKEE